MSTEDLTVQETGTQVREFVFPFGALEPLEWEGPLGPALPTTVPTSLEEVNQQGSKMTSLIRRASALQMSDQDIYKLQAYKDRIRIAIYACNL